MGSNSTGGPSHRRTYKSSGHKRKNKLKPNDPLPPGTTTKELSCASCRIRKTRCSGDRPACVQCIRGAATKGYPADGVHCVFSAASVFAKKEDVAFEAQVGGRGAKCIWDGARPPSTSSNGSTTSTATTEVPTANSSSASSSALAAGGDQEETIQALLEPEAPSVAIESPDPANQHGTSPSYRPPLRAAIVTETPETVSSPPPRSPLPPLSPFPPTSPPAHRILPPPAPQLPAVSTPCPLDHTSRSSISRIFLSRPPPPLPPLDLGRPVLGPLAHDGLLSTPFLLPRRSASPPSPTTPEEPLPSTAEASFWEWGPLTPQEVAQWPGMKYAATQAGLFLTGAFL
ncbi:hypothetical protein BMF94_3751 [Rhodotorula taiwanensis]|uniref:Zn(2)-C6 fungal-type domain-containing protein n=1 Tax=Rhodotorula taiwanensis TaxID=741276 RepID=A0A2S5B9G5_9BASI|nr:hypothetical protein BMF94_3751 [Rhodotorula taiwanensis]